MLIFLIIILAALTILVLIIGQAFAIGRLFLSWTLRLVPAVVVITGTIAVSAAGVNQLDNNHSGLVGAGTTCSRRLRGLLMPGRASIRSTVTVMLELRHELVPVPEKEKYREDGCKKLTGAQFCHAEIYGAIGLCQTAFLASNRLKQVFRTYSHSGESGRRAVS